jgi:hypothetical protein
MAAYKRRMPQELQTGLDLSSSDAARNVASHPLFSRPAVFAAYGVVAVIVITLLISIASHSAALIQPIAPGFHAMMIGLGVFVGVLLAAISVVGRTLGIGTGGRSPLMSAIFIPLLITGLCGYSGSYAAERIIEWKAFHGMTPETVDTEFTVLARHHGKSSYGLQLQPAGTDYKVSLGCSGSIYWAVATGDRLILPVEIGRGGVERTQLPASLSDLKRG